MGLIKGHLKGGFLLPECEKHFHDHDETWLILEGAGTGYWIDHDGKREDFVLEAGDVWMIPAGFEHGSDGPNSADFRINVFMGTMAPGSHSPGHYYVENEGYIPRLVLDKQPTTRYKEQEPKLPETQKAIMFTALGVTEFVDEPVPVDLGPKQVLCESLYTGITNGTERNVMTGGNYGQGIFPNRCGYQNVGRIIRKGVDTPGWNLGDIVYSGAVSQHRPYWAVDVARPGEAPTLACKLPEGVDLKEAALLGMAGVALHDVRRANVRIGERVLVVGAGSIGQFTAQAALAAGADVTIADLDEERLGIAKSLGVHRTVLLTKDPASWDQLRGPKRFDAVFEDSGAPILDDILGHGDWSKTIIRHLGRLVLIAGRNRVEYPFNSAQGIEIEILQASHFTGEDLELLVKLFAEGRIKVGPLLRDVVPYEDALATYERLRDNPGSMLGTVFDYGKA